MLSITKSKYGQIEGQTVYAYKLQGENISVTLINYGARITEILTPDKHGNVENVVLGYDSLEDYIQDESYQGALCGRVAGRIGNARFTLDDVTYQLAKNNGDNNLHGGVKCFSHVVWQELGQIKADDCVGITLTYYSKDGEEGFPGNVEMKVTYLVTNQDELIITYTGIPDKKTIINVTNHAYFNLNGNGKGTILNHQLTIPSASFGELGTDLIPTGALFDVANTPFDFRTKRTIGEAITKPHKQLTIVGSGIDHPFLLAENKVILEEETSGRMLVVETDKPAVVVYTGNMMTDDMTLNGRTSEKHMGICLETQGMPDAINQPNFPSIVVGAGKVYHSETKFTFKVRKN